MNCTKLAASMVLAKRMFFAHSGCHASFYHRAVLEHLKPASCDDRARTLLNPDDLFETDDLTLSCRYAESTLSLTELFGFLFLSSSQIRPRHALHGFAGFLALKKLAGDAGVFLRCSQVVPPKVETSVNQVTVDMSALAQARDAYLHRSFMRDSPLG